MKTSFLKIGKLQNWFDVAKQVLDNRENFNNDDWEYFKSQSLVNDIVTGTSDRIEIFSAKKSLEKDLGNHETTRIYKFNGKYYVDDDDDTKKKLHIGRGYVRVIDVPTSLKGYKTSSKTKFPFNLNIQEMF